MALIQSDPLPPMKILPPIIVPPVSALYGAVTRTRLALYRHKLFSASRLDAFVVSVGNITTGGTGKTPLVEWLVRFLAAEGRNVCILTRGYRRKHPSRRVLVSNKERLLASVEDAGDEAFLLASNLKGIATVVCDADRAAAGRWAIDQLNVDTFVLDDGFQHLRLHRDLDIVTIDATNPWGGGRLLPFGRLREPLNGLSRADCIVLTRTEQVDRLDEIQSRLKHFTDCPQFLSEMSPSGFSPVAESPKASTSVENPIVAFCGIGNPSAFLNQLKGAGYDIATSRVFADHHEYKQEEIDWLNRRAQEIGARCLVTTAKDAVKLSSFNFSVPCWSFNIQLDIRDEERFRATIRQISNLKSKISNLRVKRPLNTGAAPILFAAGGQSHDWLWLFGFGSVVANIMSIF
jgi:tetraacyldisaccharide 4'-kinase